MGRLTCSFFSKNTSNSNSLFTCIGYLGGYSTTKIALEAKASNLTFILFSSSQFELKQYF